ncbi:MAG TPA: hypothetical protein VN642_19490 [Dongiaceae bacterium]|nr:hypothetical protein [Dongiaceae bacterium]
MGQGLRYGVPVTLLAFAMSQMFSPKQKELFKKRLEGLPLSKTEQEYYSRSVKKKVVALASAF